MLKSQSGKYKVIVRKSKVPKMDWKEKIRDLSTSLNNLSDRRPTKGGGGGLRPPPPFVGSYYAGATADATGVAVVFLALVLRIISTCRKHVVSFGHTFLTCRKHVVGFGHANLPKS